MTDHYPAFPPVTPATTNWPRRRLISGLLSLPLLLGISVLLVTPALMLLGEERATNVGVALPLTLLAEILAITAGLAIGWPKSEWRQALGLRKPKIGALFLAAGLGIVLFFGLQAIAIQMAEAGQAVESSATSKSLEALEGFPRILVFFIISPFIGPIIEELFFRGWVFNALLHSNLKENVRKVAAFVLPSLFFAVVHMQGVSSATDILIPTWIFFVALIETFLMYRYKSIWVPITLHVFYNGITVLLSTIAS